MSRLTDDVAQAAQRINAIASNTTADLGTRKQALGQLQQQIETRLREIRMHEADQLEKGVMRA